jgi:hypothetical protein
MTPRKQLAVKAVKADGSQIKFTVTSRLDTEVDVEYFENGGNFALRDSKMMAGGFDVRSKTNCITRPWTTPAAWCRLTGASLFSLGST